MNHFVVLDAGTNEIKDLVAGTKSMIIRGADVKCIPYNTVSEGDILYFVDNKDCTVVNAKGVVSSVYNSYPLTEEESYEMIIRNQDKLILPDYLFYRWAGKKYLVLIGLKDVREISPFSIKKNNVLISTGWYTSGNKKY
jgi:hypothetical protein